MRNWVTRLFSWWHPGDRLLTAHMDGEAPAWLSRAVRRHLECCPRCRSQAAAHEQVLQALLLADTGTDEQALSQMVSDGRAKLLRSMGGTMPAAEPAPKRAAEAELIFGCRNPDAYLSGTEVTLESMYDALLGSRAGGSYGGR